MGRIGMAAGLAMAMAFGTAGCSSGADDDPEMVAANDWLQDMKKNHRERAEMLAQECHEEVGFSFSREGVLKLVGCMKRKDAALPA